MKLLTGRMDFEKFVQLIMQATGTISSLQCITANLVSFITVMIFHKHITYLYGTLNGMDNSIINVATWGLLFSVYIMIYKAVSAVFIVNEFDFCAFSLFEMTHPDVWESSMLKYFIRLL